MTFNETSRKQHSSGRENTFEEYQVEQSTIMLLLDVLKGKNMMPAVQGIQRKISFIHKEAINIKRTIVIIKPRKTAAAKDKLKKLSSDQPLMLKTIAIIS